MAGRVFWSVAALALAGIGCKGDDDALLVPDQITKVPETDGQVTPVGSRSPLPLAVIVRTADGTPVPHAKVWWRLPGGSGSLADSLTVSDGNGRAQVDFRTGILAGPYSIQSTLVVAPTRSVTFALTATDPPVLTSVSPAQFAAGDLVTLQGTGLGPTTEVEFAGATARVTSASPTSVTAVVPACLAPGPVVIRAGAFGTLSTPVTGTFMATGDPLTLAVGGYASIDPAYQAGCATFPAAGPGGAEYLVAPQAATGVIGVRADFRVVGDTVGTGAVSAEPVPERRGAAATFHDFLRRWERERPPSEATWEAIRAAAPVPAAAAAAVKVGDRREFRVCNRPDCVAVADFSRVEATARYVGDHLALFVDVAAPVDGFTAPDLQSLGDLFEDALYDVDTRAYGVESDVDLNGLVLVLFTPVVNGLTPRSECATSVVTGFFYAIDIDPAYALDVRANHGEVFYAFSPDPTGTVTCTVTVATARRIVTATFAHEFQHMISYHQHSLLRRAPAERVWLNEAMSHLAEELAGRRLRELNPGPAGDSLFSNLALPNVFNAYQYLKFPASYFMEYGPPSFGTLAERGAGWLFLRWLVDRYGEEVTRRLSETRLVGVENIVNAAGEPMPRLLSRWFLANYVSDLPGFTAPPELTYTTWAFRTTYGSLNQQQPARYDRPFPLVPQVATGGTLSATGTLRAGSGDYFRVVQAAGEVGFTLRLTDPAGQDLDSTVSPRLNVIRIR